MTTNEQCDQLEDVIINLDIFDDEIMSEARASA